MPQAWQIHLNSSSHDEYSSSILQNLTLATIPKPTPGPHSVLVRMRAAALNFRDLLVIADSPNYPTRTTQGLVPCSDGAGEIEALGPHSRWNIGSRVILSCNQCWKSGDVTNFSMEGVLGGGNVQGALTQYRVVHDDWLVPMPDGLSFEEAASMLTAGTTAVNALFHHGLVSDASFDLSGKTVLAQGTGGVSCFVIQLASRAGGARVIATTSTPEKMDLARSLGAAEVVNYRTTPDWAAEVLRLTDGKGVDLVVEVGGAGTIEQSLMATRFGGTVVVMGILTASRSMDLVPAILFGAKKVIGSVGSSQVMAEELGRLVSECGIRPVVGKRFEWEDAPKAFEAMMGQGVVGKIVITI